MRLSPWLAAPLLAAALLVARTATRAPEAGDRTPDLHWAVSLSPEADLAALALVGRAELHLVELGSGARRRVPVSAPPSFPHLAPDGGHVAFTAAGRLRLLDLRSGREQALAPAEAAPGLAPTQAGFAPDGRRLAYVVPGRDREGAPRYRLVLRHLDGGDEVVLVETAEPIDAPVFSPDGARLAFRALTRLYLVETSAPHRVNLAADPPRPAREAPALDTPLGPPAWDADGVRLAYAAAIDGCPRIVVVDHPGQGWSRLPWPELCGRAPRWIRGDYALTYLREPAPGTGEGARIWSQPLYQGGWSGPIGFSQGLVTSFATDRRGDLIIAGSQGHEPLSIWRFPAASEAAAAPSLIFTTGEPARRPATIHRVHLASGALLTVSVYQRLRSTVMGERGPAVIWNGGATTPWSSAVRALALTGAVVIVPARRLSGEEERELRGWAATLPDVNARFVSVSRADPRDCPDPLARCGGSRP